MAHKRPGVFKGQVRGVSHQGQEKTLHLKAEYIDADFPSFETFPLHSHGGPYIQQVRISRARLRRGCPFKRTNKKRGRPKKGQSTLILQISRLLLWHFRKCAMSV